MNYKNIDLNTESDTCIVDPLTFEGLITAIECNIEHKTPENITKEFEGQLARIVEDARFVFEESLNKIINHVN